MYSIFFLPAQLKQSFIINQLYTKRNTKKKNQKSVKSKITTLRKTKIHMK